MTILIVDDDDSVRDFVDRVLRHAGYVTSVASNGPEALQVAANLASIDVLVADLMMPGMTGDEVARRLRQDHPELKVLYFTGYSDQLFDKKGTMWEEEAFLEKPCSVAGLLEAVSLLCTQHLVNVHLDESVLTS